MASKVNKLLETFNKIFIVPKRAKHIDDKSYIIHKYESEQRISLGIIRECTAKLNRQ